MASTAGITAWIRTHLSFQTVFLIIVLLAAALRFWALDLKLYHHDEAVHGWFAYRLLQEGVYVYDPSYHGPFLYYVTAGMFALFGDSDLVGRLLPAVFGLSLIPLVYIIHRLGYLDRRQTLVAALFIAISPELVYFSRFLRHDIFQLAFTLLLLVALLLYHRSGELRYALLAGLAAGLGMCCKEDMPLILLIFLSYGIYLLLSRKVHLPSQWKRHAVLSSLLFCGTMILFYSSFGNHWEVLFGQIADVAFIQQEGLLAAINQTGWYQAVEHWASMHGICRICGPWFFYFLLLILYELPILILAVMGIIQFIGKDSTIRHAIARVWGTDRRASPTTAELVERSLVQIRGPKGLQKQEEFMRFSIYWLLLSLGAYAYIGEKVPWLVLHQLLPLIFVSVYAMTQRKAIVAVLFSIFLILCLWHVAFVPADVNEPVVQVQNSEDLRTVMVLIDDADTVAIASSNYWPLPWYYRGERADKLIYYGSALDAGRLTSLKADMIITYDAESYESLPGFTKKTYKINYWFSYYDNENRLLEYYVKRDGKMGSMNFDVFTRIPE